MDLLASIFAYFGTVTTMIIAVGMSYDVFVYTPLHSTPPHSAVMAARLRDSAATPTSIARGPSANAQRGRRDNATAPQSTVKPGAGHPRYAKVRPHDMRRPARQGPLRAWASPPPPEALGYADERRAMFDYQPFQ